MLLLNLVAVIIGTFITASKGGGQILICTAGEGWYQEEGKEAVSLKPGVVITIPANVKHWHGAKKGKCK